MGHDKVYKKKRFVLSMTIKELTIQVRISNEGVATVMKKKGFEETASSNFEVIGILQNLIHLEQEKMNKVAYAKK